MAKKKRSERMRKKTQTIAAMVAITVLLIVGIIAAMPARDILSGYIPVNSLTFFYTFVVFFVAAVILGILFYLVTGILNPIEKITKTVEEISIGNLDVEIDQKLRESKDEVGALARAFERTIISLKLAMTMTAPELKTANEMLQSEITERKKTEEELRRAKTYLESTLNSSPDLVFTVRKDGTFNYFNPRLKTVTGYTPEQLRGKQFIDYIPKHQKAFMTEKWKEINEGRLPQTYETDIIKADGNVAHVSVSTSVLEGFDEFLAILRDITEQKKAEEALMESTERFRVLSDLALEGIVIHDQGVIVETNKALTKMFGYANPSELIGQSGFDMMTPESQKKFREHLKTGSEEPYEAVGVRKDGKLFPIEIHGRNTVYKGRPVRVGSIYDLTERKQFEEKLRRLNRVYSVTSDINQAIVRSHDRQKLFDGACHTMVEKGLFGFAWIGIVDEKTSLLGPVAQFGKDGEHFKNIKIAIGKAAKPSEEVGIALQAGRHYVCNDTEKCKLPWRNLETQHGCSSFAIFPIMMDGRVIGALGLCSGEKGVFDEPETKLLTEVVTDISFAIKSMELEEKRQQTEKMYRTVLESSTDLIWMEDVKGIITYVNKVAADAGGYKPEEVVGKPFTLGIPKEDVVMVSEMKRKALSGEHVQYGVGIYDKAGNMFTLSVSTSPVYERGTIIGTVSFGRVLKGGAQSEVKAKTPPKKVNNFNKNG